MEKEELSLEPINSISALTLARGRARTPHLSQIFEMAAADNNTLAGAVRRADLL